MPLPALHRTFFEDEGEIPMACTPFATRAVSVLAMAICTSIHAGTVTTDGADIVLKTKGGLSVSTVDDRFSFEIGGRLQADYGRFDGVYTKNGSTADSAYLRRARLEVSGKAFSVWGYDFAVNLNDDSSIKEASVSYLGFDPVTLKIGRFDPDFGLEKATSSKWITAIERNMAYDIAPWVNDRDDGMGMQVSGTTGMFYGSAGFNRGDSNDDDNGKGRNNYNVRAVIAPMAEPGNVLHLGVNYAYSDVDSTNGRIRTRMGVRGTSENSTNGYRPELAPRVTNGFDNDRAWGLEAAWAAGPFSVQGEYLRRDLDARSGTGRNDRKATGYYGQVAYTLTGESRGYKLDGGKFDKIKPNDKSIGAWELFYRYDRIDVDESDFIDSNVKGHTVGVNWYANETVKVSANYLKARTSGFENTNGDNTGDALTVRLQYVF
jgi:phosphate-selective porin OprO/OprP